MSPTGTSQVDGGDSPTDDRLAEALRESQRLGMLGARPIPEVIDHARGFVAALDGVEGRVVDLGSGGGVPGLVVAWDRPDLAVTMIDRRQKRTDFVERMVIRLGLDVRVDVRCGDVRDLVRDAPASFDAVTARGFGPPRLTLGLARALIRPGGRIVISEPPSGERWDDAWVADLQLVRRRLGTVAVFDHLVPPAQG